MALKYIYLENENENLKKIQLDYNQTCRQLESYQSIQNEKDALENYYREALQDRSVYESRSIEVIFCLILSMPF